MARQKKYKIKRYKKISAGSQKAGRRPVTVVIFIIILAGLVYLGMVLFKPVSEFIMSINTDLTAGMQSSRVLEEEAPLSVAEGDKTEQNAESKPEPVKPVRVVQNIGAVYIPFEIASDTEAVKAFIAAVPAGTNTLMIEIKNSQGQILYDTKTEKAIEWEAVSDKKIDIPAIVKLLKSKNMHLAVRMHAFSDPIAARGNREINAIKYQNTDVLWLDNFANSGGKPWLNPYIPDVRQYLLDIAKEAVELGAVMVIMDSVRFPDDMTNTATFGEQAAETSRGSILSEFIDEARAAIDPLGARVALYVPCTAIEQPQRDQRYGGNPLDISENIILGILPEQLETGYLAPGVNVTRPGTDLSKTIQEVLHYAKTQPVAKPSVILPMLSGNPQSVVPMTNEKITAQITACAESGNSEYILYSPDGVYPTE